MSNRHLRISRQCPAGCYDHNLPPHARSDDALLARAISQEAPDPRKSPMCVSRAGASEPWGNLDTGRSTYSEGSSGRESLSCTSPACCFVSWSWATVRSSEGPLAINISRARTALGVGDAMCQDCRSVARKSGRAGRMVENRNISSFGGCSFANRALSPRRSDSLSWLRISTIPPE